MFFCPFSIGFGSLVVRVVFLSFSPRFRPFFMLSCVVRACCCPVSGVQAVVSRAWCEAGGMWSGGLAAPGGCRPGGGPPGDGLPGDWCPGGGSLPGAMRPGRGVNPGRGGRGMVQPGPGGAVAWSRSPPSSPLSLALVSLVSGLPHPFRPVPSLLVGPPSPGYPSPALAGAHENTPVGSPSG